MSRWKPPKPFPLLSPYEMYIVIGAPKGRFLTTKRYSFKLSPDEKDVIGKCLVTRESPLTSAVVKAGIKRVLDSLNVIRFQPSLGRGFLCLEGNRWNVYEIIGTLPKPSEQEGAPHAKD
jgi:hypothetical protein